MNRILHFFSMDFILPVKKRKGEIPTTKEAYKTYLSIAWPAAMQGLLIDLMMAIDLAMVGSLGAAAMASVGIISQPKMVLLILCRALSVPVTAIVARRKGEERFLEMNGVLKQSILLNGLIYIPILLITYLYLSQVLLFAGAKTEILDSSLAYGKFIVIGLFFASFTQVVGAALIGIGDTKRVFIANVAGNVVNTLLNVVLIYGIAFLPKMGVRGAGIATMAGNIVTAGLILWTILQKNRDLTLQSRASWRFKKETLLSIVKMGGSSLGEQSFERFGMFAYTKMVASLGIIPLATHQVCMNLCDIFYSFAMGLGYAGASHTGQNLGKNREDLASAYGKIGMRVGFLLSIIACLVYIGLRYPLIGIYTRDQEVLSLGAGIIILMGISSFPQTIQLVCSGVLKGAGDNLYVMLYSLFDIAIFRPIFTYFLCFTCNLGLYGAWIALLCDQSLRMIFSWLRFHSQKWKSVKV